MLGTEGDDNEKRHQGGAEGFLEKKLHLKVKERQKPGK